MLHSTYTHQDPVDSRLLVVGSQTASLILGPSFDHNLCCRYLNGSYEAILDIYTSRPFQRYKELFNARCFDPRNQALRFWETQRTPSSHFWKCEFHPHTYLKLGLRDIRVSNLILTLTPFLLVATSLPFNYSFYHKP